MKYHTRNSLPHVRQALMVAAAIGASAALAQTSGTGGTSTTTDTTRKNNPPTSATGSGYQSATAPADVDSTRDINTQNAAKTPDKLSWGDRRFVNKAADGGQTEVQVAQLAAQRATNPDVRTYAQKLVDDHSKVNTELMSLARRKNVTVDKDDDKDRSYKRLNKKSGADFDQEFIEHMIDEHEKEIKMFEKAAKDAKDVDVRSFAAKHVDHLRDHLRQAQNLQQSVMPTGRTDSSSGRSTPGGTDTSGISTSSTGSSSTETSSTRSGSSSSSGTKEPPKN